MTMEMELIKRYIYAVSQKLPAKQRADIEKELQGLIEDMLDERVQGRKPGEKDVEQVLLELGNPSELAEKYRETKRYLISPEMFSNYLLVMKIVLISIGIAMAVIFAIETTLNPANIMEYFVDGLVSFLFGCFQGFAWVTIIFGIIEYAGIDKEKLGIKGVLGWKPSDLPLLPDHRTDIKISTPISSIVFNILFMVMFTFSIDQLGRWVSRGDSPLTVVPIFDEQVFRGFLPFFLALIALSIFKDIILLIKRRWTLRLIGLEIFLIFLYFVFALFLFADSTVWNPDFMQQLVQSGVVPADGEGFETVSRIWNDSREYILNLIGIVLVIHVITLVVKAFRIKNFV